MSAEWISPPARHDLAGRRFSVGRVPVERIIDLRWQVLRQGLPRTEASFSGDQLSTSLHWAAAEGDAVVCCATFHLNEFEGTPAYQLRGMATADGSRGIGLGTVLLRAAEAAVAAESSIRTLWCNARVPALGFYERAGWAACSDLFYIPTAGPHRKMFKRL